MNLEFRIYSKTEKTYGQRADLSEDRMDWEFGGGYVTLDFALKHPEHYIVEQWTGLVDKNGVKIFLGDLVVESRFKDTVFTVEYKTNGFCLLSKSNRYFWVLGQNKEDFEIIGNVNQNPELLNQ